MQDEVFAGAKAFVRENKGRYDCYGYIYTGEGQNLGQFFAELAVGNGKIQKSSSNTTVTNGNDCYSLSGATYGVYSDKGCTKSVATLTTNANGNTDTVELRAATYYVKETKAPKGFQLDKNVYTMTVKVNETTTLKVSDKSKVTDTLVELFKIDMEISKATPQGNASLEGAEFVWKYYDGYYTKDNLPSEPTRTWTTKTIAEKDSNNEVHYITRLADSYKVLGDSFYTQNGTICLPLGTITVEEKTAPNGYLLEGAYMQAAGSSEQIKGVYVAQITEDGELAALSGSNQYSVLDKVIVNGGDMLPKQCDRHSEQSFFINGFLDEYFEELKKQDITYLAMLGNDDLLAADEMFDNLCDRFENVSNIAGRKFSVNGYEFIGMNYILDHPFGCKDRVVTETHYIPQRQLSPVAGISNAVDYDRIYNWLEYSRTELPHMCDVLKKLPLPDDRQKAVYVMHMPPAGLRLGQLRYQDLDIGSVDIYEFLKEKQPLLSLHGHIHESPDTEKGKWINQIHQTTCIQTGQTELNDKYMVYAEIDLQEKKYERKVISVD